MSGLNTFLILRAGGTTLLKNARFRGWPRRQDATPQRSTSSIFELVELPPA